MKRRIGSWAGFLAFAAALTTAAVAPGAQDQTAKSEMMAQWKALGTPGEGHKVLEKFVGKWSVTTSMRESATGDADETTATCDIAWTLDRHFLEETTTGSFHGEPFTGRGALGYDNFGQKYVMTWMDNLSTMIMTAEGTYDPELKEMKLSSQCPDFATGKYVPSRWVISLADPDHWTTRIHKTGSDGRDFVAAEMHYRRAKE